MSIGYVRLATPDFRMLERECDEWHQCYPDVRDKEHT